MNCELEALTQRERTADFGTKNYRPFNRGNKLKRVVEESLEWMPENPPLLPMASVHDQFEVWESLPELLYERI